LTKSPLHFPNVELASPQHLRDWLLSRMPPGAEITNLNLFCTADLPNRALCLIGFRNVLASEVANALRGQPFAFDSAVVSLPVSTLFTCRSRLPGQAFTNRSCSCCPDGKPEPSLLDR
jgi:hypothetical protein